MPFWTQEFLYYVLGDRQNTAQWFGENNVTGTCNAPPKYSPEFWSSEVVNRKSIPKTQNLAEAWHHHINQVINKKQPRFYHLIEELNKEIVIVESDIDKTTTGSPPGKET